MHYDVTSLACELPGGLLDADGARETHAELRPLTGAEEDWLAANPEISNASAVTHLLSTCLVRLGKCIVDSDLVQRLLVGDRDFLMLRLRRLTLGDQFRAVLHCPACSAKMDVDFDANDVPVERRPQTSATYVIERRGRPIRFRLPVGGDQEAATKGLESIEATETLFKRCLLDEGGAALSKEDRAAVIEEMDRVAPQVELELSATCPECSHGFVVPFDTTAFFLQEMRISGKRLMREAHLLAFYYHWSEAEILGLRRDRRRAYLAILSDALRAS